MHFQGFEKVQNDIVCNTTTKNVLQKTNIMNILISWIATNHDFVYTGDHRVIPNPSGTHTNFYNHLYDHKGHCYDKHILLSSAPDKKSDRKLIVLEQHLKGINNLRTIEPRCLDIKDVVSVQELHEKVRPIIAEFQEDDIEIFISPGTPAMQVVWYLIANSFPKIKLFLVRPPQFQTTPSPIKEFHETIPSGISDAFAVMEKGKSKDVDHKNLFLPKKIEAIYDIADQIARADGVTTLILGDTGTGKEKIAEYIHKNSVRKNKPFRAINCAALGDDLLESRLFGHLEGTFTGASKDAKGFFREADKGTLFLDEIGDISLKLQKTLLRVLQDKKIAPLGTSETIDVDVRVIVGTHRNIYNQVQKGTFRADLFYRIAIAEIHTISVMELSKPNRKDLFKHFIIKTADKFNRGALTFSKEAENCLLDYSFPGNFREVENLFERFYVYCKDEITIDDIPDRIQFTKGTMASLTVKDNTKIHIQNVYSMYNEYEAAGKVLGIGWRKVKEIVNEKSKL